MKLFCFFLMILFSVTLCAAEEGDDTAQSSALSFSGYVENTFTGEYDVHDNDDATLNTTRARLNVSGSYGRNVDYAVGVVGNLYSGTDEVSLLDYVPESRKKEVNAFSYDIFTSSFENEIFLQEAFLTFYSDLFMVRFGRQKYYTGTGYAYNPTDFFNVKNPLDPNYETDGIDGVLVGINMPADIVLEGFYRTGSDFAKSDYQACLKFSFFTTDLVLQYTYMTQDRTDYEMIDSNAADIISGASSYGDFITEYTVHFAGGSIASDIAGIGFRAEVGYVISNAESDEMTLDYDRNYELFLAGFDYTFEMQLYVIIEYFRNGAGVNSFGDAGLNEIMAYAAGESDTIMKDTLFAGISYPVTDLSEAGLYSIINLSSGSLMLNPVINWSVFSGCTLEIAGVIPVAESGTYEDNAGFGGYVRAKVSF